MLILYLLLRDGEMHGYELMKRIRIETKGSISPSPGNIYPSLHELASKGFVTVKSDETGRKIYSLTEKGREAILKKREFIENLLRSGPSEVIPILEDIHAIIAGIMSRWRCMEKARKEEFLLELRRLRSYIEAKDNVGC
ncbi:MAG: PadR family transcriptional regulator [Sulfolobales archaeon]